MILPLQESPNSGAKSYLFQSANASRFEPRPRLCYPVPMSTATLEKQQLISADQFFDMPDNDLAELIDGVIVPMNAPGAEHGFIEAKITARLFVHAEANKLGRVISGEAGIFIRRNPDRIRGVDVAFISYERSPNRPPSQYLTVAPELIVEIVSPTDRWSGINEKLADYFSIGVNEVWVVEPQNETIHRYKSRSDVEILYYSDTITGSGLLSDFSLKLADLFADN